MSSTALCLPTFGIKSFPSGLRLEGEKKKGKFLKKQLTTGRKSAILTLALFERA